MRTQCRCTMHKRKHHGLGDANTVTLSIDVNSQATSLGGSWNFTASCWIVDADGREVYVQLNHDTLMHIHARIEEEKKAGHQPA